MQLKPSNISMVKPLNPFWLQFSYLSNDYLDYFIVTSNLDILINV